MQRRRLLLGNRVAEAVAEVFLRQRNRLCHVERIGEEESAALHARWTIPSPARPLFQAATANFTWHSQAEVDTANAARGPLLLISGTADHTVPDATTQATFRQYRNSPAVTELRRFEGRGHSLVIDSGWREVATACLEWLESRGL